VERGVKRLLVVVELSAVTEVLCNELQRRGMDEVIDVFLLFPRFSRNPLRRLWPAGRFWRESHARLDALLHDLTELGIRADGIATEASPADAVANLVGSFAPSEIVIVCLPRGQRYRERFERALATRVPDVSPASISWSPT